MVSLTPGILLRLIRNIGSDVKVAGAHRSVLLQVIAIIPSLAGCEELSPSHGFFLKLSDSSHATYVSLAHDLDDIILSNKMQLGQFVYVENLQPGYPLPVLTRLKLLPGRHPFVGFPDDLVSVNTSALFHDGTGKTHPAEQYFSLTKIGKTLIGSGSFANPCAHHGVVSSRLEERRAFMSGATSCPSKVADEPSVTTVPDGLFAKSVQRRSFQRASWSSQKNILEICHQKGKMAKSMVPSDVSLNSAPSTPLMGVSGSFSTCLHLVHRDEPENIVFSFDRASNGNSTGTSERKKLMQRDHRLPYRAIPSVIRNANPLFKSMDIGRSHDQLKRSLDYQDHRKQSFRSNARITFQKGLNVLKDATEACEERISSNDSSNKNGAGLHGKRDALGTSSNISAQPYDGTTPICHMETPLQTSWSNLPVALSSLGQEVLSKHSQARKDIAKALQQASVTDIIIKSLSDFADICSLQKFYDYESCIPRFLAFYELLLQSIAMAETLAKEKLSEINITVSEKKKEVVHMESDGKMQDALALFDGVISSDLRQFYVKEGQTLTRIRNSMDSTNDHFCEKNNMDVPNHPIFTSPLLPVASPTPSVCASSTMTNAVGQSVLSSSAQSNIVKGNTSDVRTVKSNIKATVSANLTKLDSSPSPGKRSIRCTCLRDRKNYTPDFTTMGNLKQTIKLAKHLQYAAENWFIKFMTDALHSGFQTVDDLNKGSIWSENDSTILEDLRKVNDWLDKVSLKHKGKSSPKLFDLIYCLKQNLYEFLIQLCLQKPIMLST